MDAPDDAGPACEAWLKNTDVAKLLGTTPKQIDNMTARGQIPAPIRVPGLRGPRWSPRVIDKWMREQMGEERQSPHQAGPARAGRHNAKAPRAQNKHEGKHPTKNV